MKRMTRLLTGAALVVMGATSLAVAAPDTKGPQAGNGQTGGPVPQKGGWAPTLGLPLGGPLKKIEAPYYLGGPRVPMDLMGTMRSHGTPWAP